MMRSLYAGVSGLKTHQTKMDVIGNNIANVNTTAYKSSSITFSELMSQTTQNASGPNAATGTGGINARQVGLGVKAGAINLNITGQGASQSTGNPFDIMINGENFFVVSNGQENFFTREGSFYVDGAGNLAMTSNGYNVMGWQVDEATGSIKQDSVSALRIMNAANLTYPPEATSKAYVSGILDKNDTDVTSTNGKVINLNLYDNLGYSYTARMTFKQSADENVYSMEFTKLLDSNGNEVEMTEAQRRAAFGGVAQTQERTTSVELNKNYSWDDSGNLRVGEEVVAYATGDADYPYSTVPVDEFGGLSAAEKSAENTKAIDAIAKAYGFEGSTSDFLSLQIPVQIDAETTQNYSVQQIIYKSTDTLSSMDANLASTVGEGIESPGRSFYGYEVKFDPDTGEISSVGGSSTTFLSYLNLAELGDDFTNFSNIEIDMSEISMYDNKGTSTVSATSGDLSGVGTGRRLGNMIGVSVQNNGMIYASYDNGMTKLLGQLASAAFANASGLERAGDNLYSATLNSGEFDGVGVDITANGGYMSTGMLEMSNVDLSSEFTEMITTQRGFQANSRIITVSDTLLEELTNLKR
ncbi:MAG: flagellar hook-basal body complex protein [Lachnospiraceae bacterium]|nr:flagellar hook-basal body complex protein [Lachnospiraceae bacterium]